MTNRNDETKIPLKIDVGAKATLEAKISTEIPSSSSGRLLDALTDIIRPFSEGRGLKADQIRLQREEVLIKVAQLARERISIESRPIEPVPTKTLIPLLEKASLEDLGDDYMIERWANLLASSAGKNKVSPNFINILSSLNTDQASLLEAIFFKPKLVGENNKYDGAVCDLEEHQLNAFFSTRLSHPERPMDNLWEAVESLFNSRGYQIEIFAMSSKGHKPTMFDKSFYIKMDQVTDLQVLVSLNLLEKKRFLYEEERCNYNLSFYQITVLGLVLLRLCIPQVDKEFRQIEEERDLKRKERARKPSPNLPS